MPVYQSTFEFHATAGAVWAVLTDLGSYGQWNPQIPEAGGKVESEEVIDLRLAMPGRPSLGVSATIEEVVPSELLTWRGHVLAPWFFEGYRKFAIEFLDAGSVSVTHVEDVHGWIAPVFALAMGGPAQKSHGALNAALRVRAEALPEKEEVPADAD